MLWIDIILINIGIDLCLYLFSADLFPTLSSYCHTSSGIALECLNARLVPEKIGKSCGHMTVGIRILSSKKW